jgi:hypothetical protein
VVGWLNPIGLVIGLNGVVMLAYIVAVPAMRCELPQK